MRMKILGFCLLFSCISSFAEDRSIFEEAQRRNGKVYVHSDQILLHEKQIWVDLGSGWIPVAELFSDEHGFYVPHYYSDPDDITPGTWVCPCGQLNSIRTRVCVNVRCPYK